MNKPAVKGGLVVLGLIVIALGLWGWAERRESEPKAREAQKAQQAITAGLGHTCSLSAGTVSCWGNNGSGQLGTTTNSGTGETNPKPTPVVGLANVTAITAGHKHTCALADGTVSCWGSNESGQLGNTTNSSNRKVSPTPAPVAGLTDVTAITAGHYHTCALADGTVSCWGDNDDGQLGTTSNSEANPTPTPVAGLTDVTSITAGQSHTCALADGIVFCWGANRSGQLGNTVNNGVLGGVNSTPTLVAGLTDVTAIAATAHACALVDSTVFCWGSNYSGELGNTLSNGTVTEANPKPTQVAGLTDVTAITAGDSHSCALVDGAVFCWGANNAGQLGNTNISKAYEANPTPTPVVGFD